MVDTYIPPWAKPIEDGEKGMFCDLKIWWK